MFRNLRFYRLESQWPESEEAVSTALEQAAFAPCGPLTERSSGFVAIDPDTSESLARRVNAADLLRLRTQSRVLPASVVNEELELRLEEYRERMGEAPPAREKRRLKAEVRDELMPRSMVRSDRIWGYADLKQKIIGVGAAQEAAAERFIRRLQASIDGLNIRPLQFAKPVGDLLVRVLLQNAPGQFAVGNECRMKDPLDAKATVRWSNFDLANPAIRDQVAAGLRLTHLSITYDNVMNFVLDENGILTKLRFLGMDDDNEELEDPLARLDAEFVLVTGTLRRLIDDLGKLLGV